MSTLHTIGGRAYPVRHYPIAVRLRDRKGHAILCIALNPQSGDFSGAILEVPFKALLHGRWNRARYMRGENLKKKPFFRLGVGRFILGSSLVLLWFVLGLLHGA